MLYGLVVVIHVIACIILIAVILLQAGRGGGINETFGGVTQSFLGTKANVVLTRATEISAVVFLCTCLLLGIMTSRRGKSLIALQRALSQAQVMPSSGPAALPAEEGALDETSSSLPDAQPEPVPSE
ncbi:MAG: preprotein translocase subunit SecG [Candidatus Omnitrophota bacterium]